MRTIVFEPRPLPPPVAGRLRARLREAHRREPFSTIDPRGTVRRVAVLAEELGLAAVVYRGGVDLRGSEVDHVWLAVSGAAAPGLEPPSDGPYVLDASFPLFAEAFLATLRRFVAGDADTQELVAAADGAGVDERVVGDFPRTVRYLGMPVWSAR